MRTRSRAVVLIASLIPILTAGCEGLRELPPQWTEPPAETYTVATFQMGTDTGPSSPIDGAKVTTDFFEKAHAAPLLGRAFLKDDVSAGSDVVMLSESLWKSHFGADPAVVGTLIRLDSRPFVIIGVAPRGYDFPKNARLWVPKRAGG